MDLDVVYNTVYNMDCLEGMKKIPDNSIDLIVIDPPYNIGKDKRWDKWKNVNDYVDFMGKVFVELERVLKDNGSFYFFHNDFMQIVELQNYINNNTEFVFKQLIVWNKKFKGCKIEHYLQGHLEINMLRNYKLMAEYCLFYTFQDETGLKKIKHDCNNFKSLRDYFECLQKFINVTKKNIIDRIGGKADHCFRWKSTQWDLPTEKTYNELIDAFKINQYPNFKEYESLRQEYESLRYTFNNQKTHHSIWNYEIAKNNGHITPKPTDLIENIILHSSNENDIILDCFMGSGTTAISCLNTKRRYIGFELDKDYYNIITKRISDWHNIEDTKLFKGI